MVMRRITNGPTFHWFGYYDKLEFDPTDRYVLGMEVDFEGRAPAPDDVIRVGMVDTEDGDTWIELGETRAWCWQQGCMLQWLPGTESTVMWNDRDGDRFVCHLLDVKAGARRTLGHPVYAVSPDGQWGVMPDFRRLNDMRPGYSYAGISDPFADDLAPTETGIWRMRMDTGEAELVLSFAEIAAVPWPGGDLSGAKHYCNHLLVSPDGSRFEFLHRWYPAGATHWLTRMFTCKPDGSDLRVTADGGFASHFIWRDPEHIAVCCSDPGEPRTCLINVLTRELKIIDSPDLPNVDGHFSYLPEHNLEWMVTDVGSGPQGVNREQPLALYHLPTRRVVPITTFHLDARYRGPLRVDLHPRSSRDGTRLVVDAAPEIGRQLYMIDIRDLIT
jgi:hypothetical protein